MSDEASLPGDKRGQRTLSVAERVTSILVAEGGDAVVIGAVALAVHGYPRATRDIDLASVVDPFSTLERVARACREDGFEARLITPDGDDPLGGVLTIMGPDFDPVQVVNYYNPLRPTPNPGADAIEHGELLIEGSSLRVTTLPHLVALKLYAGGLKSHADVLALLEANPDMDRDALRDLCRGWGLLAGLETVLRELD